MVVEPAAVGGKSGRFAALLQSAPRGTLAPMTNVIHRLPVRGVARMKSKTEWLEGNGASLAAAGAAMASIGDLGQLWIVNAARPMLQLPVPPSDLVVWATLLGAFGIPLYGLGYWARSRCASDAPRTVPTIVAVSGIAFGVWGGMVHVATGVQISNNAGDIVGGLDPMQGILRSGPLLLSLWGAAGLAFFVASACEFRLALRGLDWAFNPLVLTLVLTAVAQFLPLPWRDFVGPAAINFAHLAFFLRLTRTN